MRLAIFTTNTYRSTCLAKSRAHRQRAQGEFWNRASLQLCSLSQKISSQIPMILSHTLVESGTANFAHTRFLAAERSKGDSEPRFSYSPQLDTITSQLFRNGRLECHHGPAM